LRTLRLAGELDSHGYRHNPEHTGKRLALFPLISKRSFLCNLIVAHLLGWVWRCLFANTGQQSGEPIVVCSPTLKALKRAFCAMRFSRQSPRPLCRQVRALKKKNGTGCLWTLMDCSAVFYVCVICICIWSASAQKLYNSLVSSLIKRPVNSTIAFSHLLFESAQQIRRLFQSLIL